MILFEKKYLEVRQKYSAARRIFNSLLGVSSGDETLRLMFDILLDAFLRIQKLFICKLRWLWYKIWAIQTRKWQFLLPIKHINFLISKSILIKINSLYFSTCQFPVIKNSAKKKTLQSFPNFIYNLEILL